MSLLGRLVTLKKGAPTQTAMITMMPRRMVLTVSHNSHVLIRRRGWGGPNLWWGWNTTVYHHHHHHCHQPPKHCNTLGVGGSCPSLQGEGWLQLALREWICPIIIIVKMLYLPTHSEKNGVSYITILCQCYRGSALVQWREGRPLTCHQC